MKIIMKRIQRGIQVSIKADLKRLNLKPHLFLRDDWTTKRVADSNLIILSLSILQKKERKKKKKKWRGDAGPPCSWWVWSLYSLLRQQEDCNFFREVIGLFFPSSVCLFIDSFCVTSKLQPWDSQSFNNRPYHWFSVLNRYCLRQKC